MKAAFRFLDGRALEVWDQARFITRISEMLLDDGCNAEIRRVWVGYLTQCDADLGKRVAQKLTAKSAL